MQKKLGGNNLFFTLAKLRNTHISVCINVSLCWKICGSMYACACVCACDCDCACVCVCVCVFVYVLVYVEREREREREREEKEVEREVFVWGIVLIPYRHHEEFGYLHLDYSDWGKKNVCWSHRAVRSCPPQRIESQNYNMFLYNTITNTNIRVFRNIDTNVRYESDDFVLSAEMWTLVPGLHVALQQKTVITYWFN